MDYSLFYQNAKNLLREAATLEAKVYKLTSDRDPLYFLHKYVVIATR
jgi:hypothetical protein